MTGCGRYGKAGMTDPAEKESKMATYNSTSKKAEEFINHEQILKTLEYAEEHKTDLKLMEELLEKGREYKGLSYKEAATLLLCEDPEIIQKIFDLGKEIKEHFFRSVN